MEEERGIKELNTDEKEKKKRPMWRRWYKRKGKRKQRKGKVDEEKGYS